MINSTRDIPSKGTTWDRHDYHIMDIASVNSLVETAFGTGADIFHDVLRIPATAPQSQVQQAFFVSVIEKVRYGRISFAQFILFAFVNAGSLYP